MTFKTKAVDRATLTRRGRVVATGFGDRSHPDRTLVLSSRHRLHPGRYTLTLSWTDARQHQHTTRQTVVVT